MKIFTAAQIRELDRLTVERCGIPYGTLMETAGSRVVEAIEREYGPAKDKTFAVLCGKGNNGGDGAVIARLLWLKGAKGVAIILIGELDETKGEARTNFEAIKRIADEEEARYKLLLNEMPRRFWGEIHDFHEAPAQAIKQGFSGAELEAQLALAQRVSFQTYQNSWLIQGADIVVDALLGTGLTVPIEAGPEKIVSGTVKRSPYEDVVQAINDCRESYALKGKPLRFVSVDIPSGLASDLERPIGMHVRADLTISFTGPKIGNVLAPACDANGKLVIASIGTPEWLFDEVGSQLNLIEEIQIKAFLDASRRPASAHKGTAGDVLLIAGSLGKTGAAALTSEAILRAGAGLVTVATTRSAQTLLVTQCKNEVMTEGLDENEAGAIKHEALERTLELARNRTVVAIGPGLSSSDISTRRFVRDLVDRRRAPLVIDADGLNALAPWPDDLKGSVELPIIITPHPGEMARLTGKTNAEIVADRLNVAREFATKYHVITVLKGSRSLIAVPDGQVYINPTGNAGMATAGSGDVLTGLLTGLLAQRPQTPLEATIAAVYLHGLAGDLAAAQLGHRSLIASDLIAYLSEAILQVGGAAERGQSNSITTI
jgi:ADP-dependent NAD(P)H-hydrate dehydratase / NAD(P)H-hydrate epimerase